MPHQPLKIGVIGLGLAGGLMVPVIAAHPRVKLAGAADPNPLLRQRFEADHRIAACAGAEELIARDDIDAVYIATPHKLHADQTALAARAGKHMVVEKPMALTLPECDAMVEAAERHGVALIVGHTHSFDPAVQFMRECTRSGRLGRLAMVTMLQFTDFLYRPRRPEELDTAQGGGIVYNQLPHQVDIARAIACAEVATVRAAAFRLDPSRPTEGSCSAFLGFESGAAATMVYGGYDRFDSDEFHEWVSSTGHRKNPRHGQTRQALASDPQTELRMRSERYGYGSGFRAGGAEFQPHFGVFIASYEKGDLRASPRGVLEYGEGSVREHVFPQSVTGRSAVLDELCAAVQDGAPVVHDGVFAKGTLATCLAILESSRQAREVRL